MTQIGFLGLGIMGSRMAANLLKAGNPILVHNRTRSKAEALEASGAGWADTPGELASRTDILFTMLATPEAVEATALGSQGFLPAMHKNALWVDCSTVNPSFTRRMADEARQAGVRMVDAPVAGSKIPAEKAQLTFLVGGDSTDVQSLQPFFAEMGRQAIHAGGHGAGTSLKMVFNLLLGQSIAAFAEALLLGESLGLNRDMLFDALSGSIVASQAAIGKRAKIESGAYEADFPLQWVQKDLQLASVSAYEQRIALPLTNAAKELYMEAVQRGMGELDLSAIYAYLTQKSGSKGA